MENFNTFLSRIWSGLPGFLVAVLLIVLALIVAGVVRNLIRKGVNHFKLDEKLAGKDTSSKEMLDLLGNLGYILTLLLFLPGILDKLGLPSVTVPILGFLNGIFGYIPNLLGAAIILIVGFFLARIIKQLVSGFLKRVNVDNYQEKLGIKRTSGSKVNISDMLANIVYILILIPIIIAALKALNISVISDPAVAMLNEIFLMIPRIIAGIIILVIGFFLAKIIADFVYTLLEGSGLSEKVADVVEDASAAKLDLAKLISEIVKYVILAVFLVQAFNVIQLAVLNEAGTAILAFIPRILAAALILIGAFVLGSLLKKFIVEQFTDAHFGGLIAKYAVLTIGVLAALTQLGIATGFLLPLFQLTIAAGALAVALAFGLGGREFAAKKLAEMDSKMKASEPKMAEARARIKEAQLKKQAEFEEQIQEVRADYKNNQAPLTDELTPEAKAAYDQLKDNPTL